ncbi:hypothetical protein KUTeg_016094 [Tegillarca granosa]|uniref:ZP domain-containing protein n=1 Tax=Tegillarca granosa TaxID=220873 RepID=A0ABQ9EKZ8_TEGGR|nr:hypothetical protein KUTeg_016094 [Tegillarca granosa]
MKTIVEVVDILHVIVGLCIILVVDILHVIVGLTCQSPTQTASYMCLRDDTDTTLLHVDFTLNPNNDTVSAVYGYNTSVGMILTDCCTNITSGLHQIRITINTTDDSQVSPEGWCGYTVSSGTYTITMQSEAVNGFVTDTDSRYSLQCSLSGSLGHTLTSSTLTVLGDVTIKNLTSANGVGTLEVYKATDLSQALPVFNLGERVVMKYTYTFTDVGVNMSIIGARIINVIVSPSDSFSPITRTLIDTFSSELVIARFKNYHELNFAVQLQYCRTVESKCFTNMCIQNKRRKRELEEAEIYIVTTKITD